MFTSFNNQLPRIGILSHAVMPWEPCVPLASTCHPPDVHAISKLVLYRLGERNHRHYAVSHNYTMLTPETCPLPLATIVPVAWTKIFLALSCLEHHPHLTHILWVDADALFARPAVKLEVQMAPYLQNSSCSMILAVDKPKQRGAIEDDVNTGVWLMRVHDEVTSRTLLGLAALFIHNKRSRWSRFWEQDALRFLLHNDSRLSAQTCILRGMQRNELQTILSPDALIGRSMPPGHFIAHFSGGHPPFKPVANAFVRMWMGRIGGVLLKAEWDREYASVLRALRFARDQATNTSSTKQQAFAKLLLALAA